MSEQPHESIGRIEVAPEVLATIAEYATLRIDGISKLGTVPSESGRLFRRSSGIHHNGVALNYSENGAHFDIYVIMKPQVNIMETSRKIQKAIMEAVDMMVGIEVNAVNIHVEDVVYVQDET